MTGRWIHVANADEGSCTMTNDQGCVVVIPVDITNVGVVISTDAGKLADIQARTIHTHIPNHPGQCKDF